MRAVDVTGHVALELGSESFGRLTADGPCASLDLESLRVLRTARRAMRGRRQRRARLEAMTRALSSVDLTLEVRIGETTIAVAGASGPVNWAGRIAGAPLQIRPGALARVALARGLSRLRRTASE